MIRHSWSTSVAASVLLVVACSANGVLGAQNNYFGKYIGKLKTLHHGVSGEVYAVDARTLHIRDFNYDGEGPAAYFYAGDSKSPNGFGFRVNDENGTPNVLSRYRKKHITITLPDSKTLRDIKWFSVWCDEFSVNFGDVRIPKNLDFPKPQKIDPLNGVHKVSSDNIVVVDAQTLLIPNFSYDGEAPDAKFWVGRGNKPSPQGTRVPDENGKEEPLRRYDHKTIVLTLPKDLTVHDIGHFGVWCEAFTVDFGHIRVPRSLNVPPSLKMLGVSPQKRPRSLQQFQLPLEQQLVQQNAFSGGVVADARSNFPRRYNAQTSPTLDTDFYHDESQPLSPTSNFDDSRYTQQIQATTYKPPASHRRLSARVRQTTTTPSTNNYNNDDSSYQIIPSISLSSDQLSNQQYSTDQLRNYNVGSQQNFQNGQVQRFENSFVDSASSLNPSNQNYFSNIGSLSSRQLTNDYYREQPIQRRQDTAVDRQAYRDQQIQRRRDYALDRQAANDYYREQPAQSRRDNYRDRQSVNDYYSEQQAVERLRDDVQRSSRRFGRNTSQFQ